MSAEGKARIAAAQRKRWADQKAGQTPTSRLSKTTSKATGGGSLAKSARKSAPGKVAKRVGRPPKVGNSSSITVKGSAKKAVAKKTGAKKRATKVSSATGTAAKQARKQAVKAETAADSQ